jgi:hypothetical protein
VSAFLKAHEQQWSKPFVAFHLRNHAPEGMTYVPGEAPAVFAQKAVAQCAKEAIRHSRQWCELPLDQDPDQAGVGGESIVR